MPRI
ncbi:hypothetical protein PENPOL_c042G03624 [Penicillium polonicum]|jgi:hypothetical protein